MSIGKFNFGSLRAASEMAAWIFFAFSSEYKSLNFCQALGHCLELTVAKLTNSTLSSCGEHDPDQHDDGHHQHGL